jgi:stearoyl-CoA desaturase (delta-9 desaturase)
MQSAARQELSTDETRPSAESGRAKAPGVRPDWFIIAWFIVIHVIALATPFFFISKGAVLTSVVLYYATGMIGITLGYHRLLTHRSFKAPRWVERALATFGVLALQRSPLEWVGHHRMHHAGVDTDKDPHNARRGFWWSHLGWMCYTRPEFSDPVKLRRFARDIAADPYLNWLTGHWVQVGMQVALGLALLLLGGLDYMLWGIFVRLVVVYHVTWFVNSAAHIWGYRNYETEDISTNCWWVGILAFGEGWHNNHHAQQDVAPAWRRWWEFDLTWQVIKLMRAFGLASGVKMPPPLPKKIVFGASPVQPLPIVVEPND